MLAIETSRLARRFDATTAVDELTLAVAPGEIFGLVGPDGAGKTTTLRLLASILTPSSGQASVNGHDIVHDAEAVKAAIGYMSQRFGLYPDLTVAENLTFYADIYGVPGRARRERVDRLMDFSNLGPFRRRLAGNLSGGMKQKLGLACALVHTPKVLLLDEPTNGVDPVSRRDFWRILHQLLAEGVTIFVSTAYLDEAERCTRVGLIHAGRLLACGTPVELKRLMPATIVSIQTPTPRPAVRVLRSLFPPDSVGLFGDRVHLVTANPGADAERATAALERAGVSVQSAGPVPATLEDVFVSMLGRQESPV